MHMYINTYNYLISHLEDKRIIWQFSHMSHSYQCPMTLFAVAFLSITDAEDYYCNFNELSTCIKICTYAWADGILSINVLKQFVKHSFHNIILWTIKFISCIMLKPNLHMYSRHLSNKPETRKMDKIQDSLFISWLYPIT
jgi:hypothetical protein